MANNIPVRIQSIEDEEIYIDSKQSANVLFKFMKQYEYLENILKNKSIAPRYYQELIDYLHIDGYKSLTFPMICFCDINLSRLNEHISYYGTFGIAFNKKWGIKNGIQCINYINSNSPLRKDFTTLFNKALKSLMENDMTDDETEYFNYLSTNILFMKPLSGKMPREGKLDDKNFTDEKEWRYVPKIEKSDGIQLILPPKYEKYPNKYSDIISKIDKLQLKFEFEDIEYIMVESSTDRKNLINFLMTDPSIDCDLSEKYELLSKIIVYNNISKDW